MRFEELKAEYSNPNTNEERKLDLVHLLQEELKKICEKDCCAIICLDGIERSTSSSNVEDLYAIYAALRADASMNQMTEYGVMARSKVQNQNKYNANHPYPNK